MSIAKSKRLWHGLIASGVILAMLIIMAFAAYRPVYDYYRRSIADCIQWSNSYELSQQRFSSLSQDAESTLNEAGVSAASPSSAGTSSDAIRSVLNQLNSSASADGNKANEILGSSGCAAKQLPMSLSDKASNLKKLTEQSEQRIVSLHESIDTVRDAALNNDAAAISIVQRQLQSVASGLKSMIEQYSAESGSSSKAAYEDMYADEYAGAVIKQVGDQSDRTMSQALENAQQVIDSYDESFGANGSTANGGGQSFDRNTYIAEQQKMLGAADALIQASNAAQGIDCATEKCVALTFDDGPSTQTTPRILDALEQADVHATFFAMGGSVTDETKSIVRTAIEKGYAVDSHTWSHIDLPKIMEQGLQEQELDQTSTTIAQATGRAVNLIRPPHGSVDEDSREYIADHLGIGIALYDTDSYDWAEGATSQSSEEKVIAQARSGSIILMHDIQEDTAEGIAQLLQKLKDRGFTLVTIPELTGEYPRPGAIYYSRTNILRM